MQRLAKTDIKFLHGVGPKRAEMLAKQLDIHSYYDLLYYFPYRYVDKSKIHQIRDIEGDMPYIQLKGRFLTFTVNGEGVRKRLNALFSDGTGTIEVVWFNRVKQIQESYHTGVDYVIFGKPTEFNRHFSISHPEVEEEINILRIAIKSESIFEAETYRRFPVIDIIIGGQHLRGRDKTH